MQPRGELNSYRPKMMVSAMGFVFGFSCCDEVHRRVHGKESSE